MPVKAPPPAQAPSCFSSAASYFEASPVECPLSWNGITLYGDIDMGAGYQSHGVLFNAHYPNGVEELISKNSNGWRYTLLPNGLGQSHIGVKGIEPIGNDWSFVFNLQTGFDPYSLQLANGRNRWFRTIPIRSMFKAPTAIPAAPARSSTRSLTGA